MSAETESRYFWQAVFVDVKQGVYNDISGHLRLFLRPTKSDILSQNIVQAKHNKLFQDQEM